MLVRYFGQKINEVWTIKTLSGCLLTASETVVKSQWSSHDSNYVNTDFTFYILHDAYLIFMGKSKWKKYGVSMIPQ